jgi:O-antigen/teichoic acid export membrane protein
MIKNKINFESQKKSLFIFFKNYIWQFATFLSKVLGLFWVTPFLTTDKELFGIYSLVVSFSVFLNYADFGFFKAAHQLASQSYANNNLEEELEYIGFSGFITFIIVFLIFIFFFIISFFPNIIIEIDHSNLLQEEITSKLILILALSFPIIFFQKLLSIIFEIRLLGFKIYKIFLFCNLLPIFFIGYFKSEDQFLLVEYFSFIQIVNLVGCIIGYFLAKNILNYSFFNLYKKFRFNKYVFNKMKGLAFTSFYLFFLWFLWNEFDRVFIGKAFGASALPTFMICNLLYTSVITLNGIIFQPLVTKANYIFSSEGIDGLKKYLISILNFILPLYLIVLFFILVLLDKFLFFWLGIKYFEVTTPALFLISSFLFFTISQQVLTFLAISKNLYVINFYSTLQAVVYWIFFLIALIYFDIKELIIFKSIVIFLGHFYLIYINKKSSFISFDYYILFKKGLFAFFIVFPVYIIFNFFEDLIDVNNLISFLGYYFFCFVLSIFLYFFTQIKYRRIIVYTLLK